MTIHSLTYNLALHITNMNDCILASSIHHSNKAKYYAPYGPIRGPYHLPNPHLAKFTAPAITLYHNPAKSHNFPFHGFLSLACPVSPLFRSVEDTGLGGVWYTVPVGLRCFSFVTNLPWDDSSWLVGVWRNLLRWDKLQLVVGQFMFGFPSPFLIFTNYPQGFNNYPGLLAFTCDS